jgi:hypothetical protein
VKEIIQKPKNLNDTIHQIIKFSKKQHMCVIAIVIRTKNSKSTNENSKSKRCLVGIDYILIAGTVVTTNLVQSLAQRFHIQPVQDVFSGA